MKNIKFNGLKLKALLVERNIWQGFFAKKMGIGENELSMYIRGSRVPPSDFIARVIEFLELKPNEIRDLFKEVEVVEKVDTDSKRKGGTGEVSN